MFSLYVADFFKPLQYPKDVFNSSKMDAISYVFVKNSFRVFLICCILCCICVNFI